MSFRVVVVGLSFLFSFCCLHVLLSARRLRPTHSIHAGRGPKQLGVIAKFYAFAIPSACTLAIGPRVNWMCQLNVSLSSAGQTGADSFAFFIDFATSLSVYDTASRVTDCHIGAIRMVASRHRAGGGTPMLSAAFQSRLV
jgi:hypothetical protein